MNDNSYNNTERVFENDYYVISRDFKLISFNDSVAKNYKGIKVGDYCYKATMKRDEPCLHCPIPGNSNCDSPVYYDPFYQTWIEAIFSEIGDGNYAICCRKAIDRGLRVFDELGKEDNDKLIEKVSGHAVNESLLEIQREREAQAEEIESLNRQLKNSHQILEERNKELNRQLAVVGATSQRYFCTYTFDLNLYTFREVFTLPEMHNLLGQEGDAFKSLEIAWKNLVISEDQKIMQEFHDITKWKEYLKDKDIYSVEYRGVTSGWSRASIFAGRRENGIVTGVVYTLERIHEQKETEMKLARHLEEISNLNSELEERQAQLEESASEQEAQIEEITALNCQLQENQSQLEEATSEQESQIEEIKKLNEQLKDNLEKVNIFAALSHEYSAVHVADLDAETFTSIRRSSGMIRENYEMETSPYWETVKSMAESFVLPEIREDFLTFLEIEAMKKRMEQEKMFTYRYAVIPDETGNYVYEMTFVDVSEDSDRHLLVLGARCIDKLLQFEREEGQYNAALLSECEFFFGFDVSSGIVTEDFISHSNYDLLKKLDICFPISYDDFWKVRVDKHVFKTKTENEATYWTVEGLRRAFEEGKSTVTIHYESDIVGRAWEATIILTQDKTSHRLHAVYICKDVTETMRVDREIKQTLERAKAEAEAANSAKTSFLFNMSHDIRTPMNAIIGFRDLLEKYQDDPEKRTDYLKKIEDASNVLLSIINNVLEMARIEKGTLEIDETAWSAEQFNDTLYSIFHEMMTEKGIKFTRQIVVNNPYVYCDPIKLREVFINILSNAYKYTNAGGTVNMHLEEIPCDREGYALYQTTITDTGIGMSEEFLPHIFEEFARENNTTDNKVEGTGLGMPIVKRLIEFMNGTIEVSSIKGKGSTFIVTIPHKIADRDSLVNQDGVSIDLKLFEGKRVLLAEDNEFNAEIAIEMLEEAGFIVERAVDGLVCYNMLADASDEYYDLILMDIQMPNMNGYDTTKKIRQMTNASKANIPIIAMTANAFEEDKREAMRVGMNGHIAKPVKVTELIKKLAVTLG